VGVELGLSQQWEEQLSVLKKRVLLLSIVMLRVHFPPSNPHIYEEERVYFFVVSSYTFPHSFVCFG
jgi:hypothetical protein